VERATVKRHECGQDGGTRNRERQMVEQEPAPLVAVSAKWLDRRLTGLPCRHLLLTVSKRDVSGLLLDRDVVRRAARHATICRQELSRRV
jgi:hypothetical protein